MMPFLLKLKYHFYAKRARLQKPEHGKPYDFRCCLVTVVKNEGPYLKEWINHHLKLGVEKIVIIDNWSTDNTLEVLNDFISRDAVELRRTKKNEMSSFLQAEELHKVIAEMQKKRMFYWVGVLDPDEFVVLEKQGEQKVKIGEFLSQFKIETMGAIVFSWYMFGTSNLKTLNAKKPMVEQLLHRAPEAHNEHRQFKPFIYLPNYSRLFNNPHVPFVKGNSSIVYTDGQVYEKEVVNITHKAGWINHYWYRAEDYYNEKVKKREAYEDKPRDLKTEKWHRETCNKVVDNRINAN